MNPPVCQLVVLLARAGIDLNSFGKRFSQPSRIDVRTLVWIVIGVLAIVLLGALAQWWSSRKDLSKPCNDPKRLFWTLCWGHRLSWHQCWMLWWTARRARLSEPARVFVEPHWLDRIRAKGIPFGDESSLRVLRKRLFTGVETDNSR